MATNAAPIPKRLQSKVRNLVATVGIAEAKRQLSLCAATIGRAAGGLPIQRHIGMYLASFFGDDAPAKVNADERSSSAA